MLSYFIKNVLVFVILLILSNFRSNYKCIMVLTMCEVLNVVSTKRRTTFSRILGSATHTHTHPHTSFHICVKRRTLKCGVSVTSVTLAP